LSLWNAAQAALDRIGREDVSDIERRLMGRRGFLKLGTAGVLATALGGSALIAGAAREERVDRGLTSVGYAGGLGAELENAAWLGKGEAELVASGARLRVFSPRHMLGLGGCCDVGSLALNVDYQRFNGGVYYAWHFVNSVQGSASAPASFVVPVDAEVGVLLDVLVTPLVAEAAAVEHHIALHTGRSGGPKLRRGYYAIALQDPTTAGLPSWGNYRLAATGDGGLALLTAGGDAASFPYVTFQVEAA
jgi:hypothetical protein